MGCRRLHPLRGVMDRKRRGRGTQRGPRGPLWVPAGCFAIGNVKLVVMAKSLVCLKLIQVVAMSTWHVSPLQTPHGHTVSLLASLAGWKKVVEMLNAPFDVSLNLVVF